MHGSCERALARVGSPSARLCCLIASALCLLDARASAQAGDPVAKHAATRATLVRIEGDDFVIDAGAGAVTPGQGLNVYRSLEVRHPISRRKLRDRFVIGTLRVEQVGETLSIARLEEAPRHPLQVGDAVESDRAHSAPEAQPPYAPAAELTKSEASPGAQPAASVATSASIASSNSETRALGLAWRASLEQPPERRAELYAAHLQSFPRSPYRDVLLREIAYLRAYASSQSRLAQRAQSVERGLPRSLAKSVKLSAPKSALEGKPLELAVAIRLEAPVRSLLVHVRPAGKSSFSSLPMVIDENRHARATIPASFVRAPELQYFVEAVGSDGKAVPAVGDVSKPRSVRVRPVQEREQAPDTLPGSRVRVSSEIASFDGTSGRDYYLISEGDFLLRLRQGHLYGLRLGYGHYRGEGGTVEALDTLGLEPATAGFTYGFLETELALTDLVGIALRGTLGLGRPEQQDQQRDGVTGGFQVRARLGSPEGTRLVLAGELLPEIGQRAFLALYWDVIERFPMAAEVQVTDQPVDSDELGVRLIYELGFRVTDRLAVALRPSYQLRTIEHAGPGIGLAASFDW